MFFLSLLFATATAFAQAPKSPQVSQPAALPTPTPESLEALDEKQGFLPKSIPNYANSPAAKDFQELCRNIRMTNKKDVDLSGMETRLICGDQQRDEVGTPWAQIPPNEAA
ncbi:MAG: hypothetical protein EOP05_15315, partial [Proteobacteria bacterium]